MTEPTVQQKATLWLAVVFVLGAALGGILGYSFAHRAYASPPPTGQSPEARRAQRREKLTHDVGLTADQRTQVMAILDQGQDETKAVHTAMDPQIDAIRAKTRDKIRALLTDDQKPKFEEFLRQLDEERKRTGQ